MHEPREWGAGKDLFRKLRKEVLHHERAGSARSPEGLALGLAEMTAQLAYNAAAPRYPFDDSVIAWLPSCIRAVVATGATEIDANALASLIDVD